MAYVKTDWDAGVTPLSEENLDHLETQYDEADAELTTHETLDTGVHGAGGSTLATAADLAARFPSGLIVLWHGTIGNIPADFVICDGNNSTPNLLAKFVEGVATAATDPGATGGATSKSHASHIHTMPSHSHTVDTELTEVGTGQNVGKDGATSSDDPGNTNSTKVAAHSDIRPLFYDIAFIMKT